MNYPPDLPLQPLPIPDPVRPPLPFAEPPPPLLDVLPEALRPPPKPFNVLPLPDRPPLNLPEPKRIPPSADPVPAPAPLPFTSLQQLDPVEYLQLLEDLGELPPEELPVPPFEGGQVEGAYYYGEFRFEITWKPETGYGAQDSEVRTAYPIPGPVRRVEGFATHPNEIAFTWGGNIYNDDGGASGGTSNSSGNIKSVALRSARPVRADGTTPENDRLQGGDPKGVPMPIGTPYGANPPSPVPQMQLQKLPEPEPRLLPFAEPEDEPRPFEALPEALRLPPLPEIDLPPPLPELEPEPEPDLADPLAQPEPEASDPRPIPLPVLNPLPAPLPELETAQPLPFLWPRSNPQPEPENQPEAQPWPEIVLNPFPSPQPDDETLLGFPIPLPQPQPQPQPQPEAQPLPFPDPITLPPLNPGFNPDLQPQPKPDPKPIGIPIPLPGPKPKPDPEPKPKPDPDPLPIPIPIPGDGPKPIPKTKCPPGCFSEEEVEEMLRSICQEPCIQELLMRTRNIEGDVGALKGEVFALGFGLSQVLNGVNDINDELQDELTITIPYSGCDPEEADETTITNKPLRLIPRLIKALAIYEDERGKKLCNLERIERIYEILGGSAWFPNRDQIIPGLRLNPEEEIESQRDRIYDEDESQETRFNSIITYLQAMAAVDRHRSGHHQLPATVPEDLSSNESSTKKIHTHMEWEEWMLRQMDGLLGAWPVEMKYKNADGDTVDLEFKNLAEMQAELMGLILGVASDTDILQELGFKAIVETIKAQASAIQAADYAKANAEFLGYHGNERSQDLPLSITPGAKSIKDALKESKQKITRFTFDDKTDLMELLKQILIASEITKSVFFRKWSPGDKFAGDELKDMRSQEGLDDDTAWDDFLNELRNLEGQRFGTIIPRPDINNLASEETDES